ncbi:MAG: sensor domain-containing diguanylate cyclase [Polyangiaceae bacterium]|nr:sensor domain-containing diguanylate cyclase [Polyangiaceae bacterium]
MPERFYRDLLDGLTDGVYFVDRDRRITYWNHGAEVITGYRAAEVLGSRCWDNLLRHVDATGRELCHDGCPLTATLCDGADRAAAVALLHKEGHRVPVKVRASAIRDEAGAILGAVETFQDDSELAETAQRLEALRELAYLDALTGVGNRRYAEAELATRLAERRRHGIPFGLLFVDVDRFKDVNDRHGHEVGDAVLRLVASTLRHAARVNDFVGRWGGEELVVIAAHAPAGTLQPIGDRFRALVERSVTRTPTGSLSVTVSIGAALARADDTPATLIARADELMYRAKAAGRNRVVAEAESP